MARIEDYAMIGDSQTAALVSRSGSIDWLCLPRFDSGACFAALLGDPSHGRWQIAPKGEVRAVRRTYREGTLVLETEMETAGGVVAIVDAMPKRDRRPRLLRLIEGRRGRVPMHLELIVRFDYGSTVPWVRSHGGALDFVAGPDAIRIVTPVVLRGEGLTTVADFEVEQGDRVPFLLDYRLSHEEARAPIDVAGAIEETARAWRAWSDRCALDGEWSDAVKRSLITLKALSDAETGGIVAAPTTSLPEEIGGVRNWDYRYCWVRDATFTLYALLRAGFEEEAARWRAWLLRTVAGTPSELQIMYGVRGERRLTERELPWLPGFEKSGPVRVGNAASGQFQLDVYGELMDSMYLAWRHGLEFDPNAWGVQQKLMGFVEKAWTEPDEGIWEVRGQRRPFTHSKVMAWVAFDRAIRTVEKFGAPGPVDSWRATRKTIFDEVCREGWNAQVGAFTQFYGSKDLDAALLMMPLVGFLPASDPRVESTIRAIERELSIDGLIRRYTTHGTVDGLAGSDGAFLPCSFWMADCLALLGRKDDARALFERLLSLRNDVGLLSEEYDPRAKRMLGNFPQAFSHVALVNTALNLAGEGAGAPRRIGDLTPRPLNSFT